MARPYLTGSLDGLFWEHPGDDAPYPANRMENGLYNFATNLASNAQRISYLKLQAVTVGYTLPEAVRKAMGFGARIFISGENLFTLTDYAGRRPGDGGPVYGSGQLQRLSAVASLYNRTNLKFLNDEKTDDRIYRRTGFIPPVGV